MGQLNGWMRYEGLAADQLIAAVAGQFLDFLRADG
jgi:hypothetical protein